MKVCSNFSLFKLVIEPDSLLLEDQRSTTSSEGHNQTTFSVFIELAFTNRFVYVSFNSVVRFMERLYICIHFQFNTCI